MIYRPTRYALRIICLSVLALLAVRPARAATFTQTGIFNTDDQINLYALTLAQASAVTVETDSYGGGTLGGISVLSGGFVPVLSLFDSTGTLLFSDGADQTCSAGMKALASTGICDDAFLSSTLAAGSYTLALTEYLNVPYGPNIAAGFLEQGMGNFTGPTCGTTGSFYEADLAPCVKLNSSFAFTENITPLASPPVPEPATIWLMMVPVLALGLFGRHRSLMRS